jgi:hypothetical protein
MLALKMNIPGILTFREKAATFAVILHEFK